MFGKSNNTVPSTNDENYTTDFVFNAAGQIIGKVDKNVAATQAGYGQLQGIQTMDALGNWVYIETIHVPIN